MEKQAFIEHYVLAQSFKSHIAPEGLGKGIDVAQRELNSQQSNWFRVVSALKAHIVRQNVPLDHFFGNDQLRVGTRFPGESKAKAVLIVVSGLSSRGCKIKVPSNERLNCYVESGIKERLDKDFHVSFDDLETTLSALANQLRNAIQSNIFEGCANRFPSDFRPSLTLITDLEEIGQRYADRPTDRETMQLARIGQGLFREEVLKLWDRKCAATNCSVVEVLVASHCKPWRDSDDHERLDPNNGLPLVATLDALFDRGLIGFLPTGQICVSRVLSPEAQLELNLPKGLRRKPTKELADYLAAHLLAFKLIDHD